MEHILKFGAISIVSAVLSLVIRKNHPEYALLLGVAAAVLFLWGGIELVVSIKTIALQWVDELSLPYDIYTPLIKCVGVSVITQFACSVSKDAGQAASSAALELLGNLICAWFMLPFIEQMFVILRGLV